MTTGKEILSRINTKGLNIYAMETLEELIDVELHRAYADGIDQGQSVMARKVL
jgi:hypothetical protein